MFTRITLKSMRRRRLFRILALPLSLWFLALTTDIGGIDACPMHDGAGSHSAAAMLGMMGMPAMPGMSGMATTHAPNHSPTPAPRKPMHCTCMGVCCGCAMATLPATATAEFAVAAVRQVEYHVGFAPRPASSAPRFLLPPSIGPPTLHTV
ncbi:MAG TPA: hypothetical protein VIJ16_04615 [Gemmatimonadaceae bacterium]